MDSSVRTIVRPATVDDFEEAIELGKIMWKESYYAHIPFDDNKVLDLLYRAVTRDNYFCSVACFGVDLNGIMAGYTMPYYFSHEIMATDLAIFVKPQKRGSSAAFKLIHAFESWAKSKGVHEICLAESTGVRSKETQRLFGKLGYEQRGTVHKKRVV